MTTTRKATSTSRFGAGRRESHDASAFYERFVAPEISDDATLAEPFELVDPFVCGDARKMDVLPDASVALVVTSPPYFAGKQYEEELGRDGVPSSYGEYLQLLRDVFADCLRVLEPGGRIAVNVANLGRRPYRSLAADVTRILQDDLRMLLRGEVIWRKAEGATGSCAWGSFRSPANPVLRDLTERVVIASKGRFDRAQTIKARTKHGLPHQSTLTTDEFMAATLDVWDLPPESARRVNHPAPFPVELPERLIHLNTFRGDLVLDPFMGSGSALVAAARTGRRYVGYDLDPHYVAIARSRVADELAGPQPAPLLEPTSRSEQHTIDALAAEAITRSGFTIEAREAKERGTGISIPFVATDRAGLRWYFDVCGGLTVARSGLASTQTAWATIGRASVLAARGRRPLVLLTSHLPRRPSAADAALRSAGPSAFFDAIDLTDANAVARLASYAAGDRGSHPMPGFWTRRDLASPQPSPQPSPKSSPQSSSQS